VAGTDVSIRAARNDNKHITPRPPVPSSMCRRSAKLLAGMTCSSGKAAPHRHALVVGETLSQIATCCNGGSSTEDTLYFVPNLLHDQGKRCLRSRDSICR
jgi:hypothetical protein